MIVNLTGPAIVIVVAVAYLGIDAIVHAVGNLFEKDKSKEEDRSRKN